MYFNSLHKGTQHCYTRIPTDELVLL